MAEGASRCEECGALENEACSPDCYIGHVEPVSHRPWNSWDSEYLTFEEDYLEWDLFPWDEDAEW